MKINSQILKFSNSQILFAVFTWSVLILRFGYRFGTGDQVELLPYTLFLHDSTLYAGDFFIQGLSHSVPNERSVMATLLLPFVNHLEIFCFIFHFLSVVILVLGLERLARGFIRNQYFAWLSVLVTLIPLNDFTLGNVDLYSECFQAGSLAVAFVVWAIVLFLDKKYLLSAALLSGATFIHLLEGLNVMMVLSLILFIAVLRKAVAWKTFILFISIYAFTAAVYLFLILLQKTSVMSISNEELFRILFEFRHPHHFIFLSFPKLKMAVFFILAIASMFFFWGHSRTLFQFTVIGITGILVYAFAVDGLHNTFIGNFQFYKVTQWIKFFGVVACISIIEEAINIQKDWLGRFRFSSATLVVFSLIFWIIILNFNEQLPYKVPFQIFGLKQHDDMISICEKIKTTTAKESVFIQPFENTELKYFAQRASYVEFKANVRNRKFVREWHHRIQQVYGVSEANAKKGFVLSGKANDQFYQLKTDKIEELKQQGVTHILTRKEFPPSTGSLILSNSSYAVYQL
ncbi:MAG: DUF6798 domain-containing protein [Bacteroidota bacterium]